MKTILFLHREELTLLYIGIIKNLPPNVRVVNVAYSDKEIRMLINAGIRVDFNYTAILNELIEKNIKVDIIKIDSFFIKNSEGRFNLNAAIQSDRGFSVLSYDDALRLASTNYMVWCEIFEIGKIDLIIHEPTSLLWNHIAALMCKEQGGAFLTQSIVFSDDDNVKYINIFHDDYSCPEVERNVAQYLRNTELIDEDRCKKFIAKFRSSYDVFLQNLQPNRSYSKFLLSSIKRKVSRFVKRNKYDRFKQNIDYWLNLQDPMGDRLRNLREYKRNKIKFEEPIKGEKYYYYSFHLEPEAVVLYLGDGIYANQVKLIENIAASIPAGCYLYVKDHPHEFAYRAANDFVRLSKVPNIRLIKSEIPGKRLIKDCLGVFTINGTAGFEGVMLNKQVYCFGKSYYTSYPKVNYVRNIRDLREVVYRNQNQVLTDGPELKAFINGYLDSLHIGMVDFFMGRANNYDIDLEQNARQIAEDLVIFSQNYCD